MPQAGSTFKSFLRHVWYALCTILGNGYVTQSSPCKVAMLLEPSNQPPCHWVLSDSRLDFKKG